MKILEQFKDQINILKLVHNEVEILSKRSPLLICKNLDSKPEIMFMNVDTNEIEILDKSISDIINTHTCIAYINEDNVFKLLNKHNRAVMIEQEFTASLVNYATNPNRDAYEIIKIVMLDNLNSLTLIISNKKPKILLEDYNLGYPARKNDWDEKRELVLEQKSIRATYDKSIKLKQYVVDNKGNIRIEEIGGQD